jgi:NADH-quinone oxidoreductase subunit H
LLQSFADFLKYIVKEIVVPAGADKFVFFLAPMIAFVLAVITWAVIPFNDGWVISNINVAILYVFAISSLEVYGVIMGGWASNSKYPFLGSLRSAAQMISYEVSIGLIIIGVIISTGSMNFGDIVGAQEGGFFSWYWVAHFPMLFLFFISALAETNRPPFDLPEAESELVAGYQVEYSSTPFLLFMIGELMAVVLMCALVSLLFLGGWLSPVSFLPDGVFWMVLKMSLVFFMFSTFIISFCRKIWWTCKCTIYVIDFIPRQIFCTTIINLCCLLTTSQIVIKFNHLFVYFECIWVWVATDIMCCTRCVEPSQPISPTHRSV